MTDITTLGMAVDSSGVRRATDDLAGMTRAGKETASSATEMEKAFVNAQLKTTAFEGAIRKTTETAILLAQRMYDLALGVGRFQDLSETTGGDPAGLASIQTAADVANTSVESVSQSMQRMTLILSKADDEGKGAAKALAMLNINVDEFKRLSPDEQFRKLGAALNAYADGNSKVAISQAILGRGGAQNLTLLKELGGETERSNLLTAEQIRLADELGDSIARSRSQTRQMIEVLAVQMLPAIKAVYGGFHDFTGELIGVRTEADRLKQNKAIQEFSLSAAESFSYLADAVQYTTQGLLGAGKTAAATLVLIENGIEAQDLTKRLMTMRIGVTEYWERMNALKETQRDVLRSLGDDLGAIFDRDTIGEKIRKRISDIRSMNEVSESMKDTRGGSGLPELGDFDPNKAKAIKDTLTEYEKLIGRINEKIAIESEEVKIGRKLTEEEEFRVKVEAELNSGKKQLTLEEIAAVEAKLAVVDAISKENRQLKELAGWLKTSGDENVKNIERHISAANAAEDEAIQLEALAEQYGMSEEALAALEVQKLRDAAATLRSRKVVEDFNSDAAIMNAELERQAAALDRSADAKEKYNAAVARDRTDVLSGGRRAVDAYLRQVRDVGDATERATGESLARLEDYFTQLGTKGKADISGLIDFIISEFYRLAIVRPMMKGLFGDGAGDGGGIFNGLFNAAVNLFGAGSGPVGGSGLTLDGVGAGTVGPSSIYSLSGRADGGDVSPFGAYRVNEVKPELLNIGGQDVLLTGSRGGNVKPNNGSRGAISLSYAPTIRIDARSDRAQVAALVNQSVADGHRHLVRELKELGVL